MAVSTGENKFWEVINPGGMHWAGQNEYAKRLGGRLLTAGEVMEAIKDQNGGKPLSEDSQFVAVEGTNQWV